ncbi:hypothetical protein HZA41_01845 [Candidatus Peregrinibacteria bacterium]|nr:hypothetical protein [Candidatus Peregrinibacteria bacterium]
MNWILSALMFPIPLVHLWLHALLPWWKKYPRLFYLCGFPLWAFSFFIFWTMNEDAAIFFAPPEMVTWIGYTLIVLGFFAMGISLVTIGPKRFFVMAVIKPESVKNERFVSGPFHFFPHPAYIGYLAIAFGNFLSSGKNYALGIFLFGMILFPIVIWLEEEELAKRIGA